MTLRELQLIELDILKCVVDLCEKHRLRYFILGGTLLGAVRHKGFIPWDDDIDIGIPRVDYDKFLDIAAAELPEHLRMENFARDKGYKKYITKIEDARHRIRREYAEEKTYGYVWVDVFPLDGFPSGKISGGIHKFRILFRRLLWQYSRYSQNINMRKKRNLFEYVLIKAGRYITKVVKFNTDKQLVCIDRLLRKYAYDDHDYIGNFMGAHKFKEMFPKAYYQDGMLYDFEDMKLRGPVDYDRILTQMYGDYMTLPASKTNADWHSVVLDP